MFVNVFSFRIAGKRRPIASLNEFKRASEAIAPVAAIATNAPGFHPRYGPQMIGNSLRLRNRLDGTVRSLDMSGHRPRLVVVNVRTRETDATDKRFESGQSRGVRGRLSTDPDPALAQLAAAAVSGLAPARPELRRRPIELAFHTVCYSSRR